MDLQEYVNVAKRAPSAWGPNPFESHPDGPWRERAFAEVVAGIEALLERYDRGEVRERQLLHGKDNDKSLNDAGRPSCHDVLSHWLYYQHHPGDERWKLLGQRYWSVSAWLAWRAKYLDTPPARRLNARDTRPHLRTFPKRGTDHENGLVSEHVIPKAVIKERLLRSPAEIERWLNRNLCCVVTRGEDRRLATSSHPDPADPWLRYRGAGIVLLHNPDWTEAEIEPLLRHGLLSERSVSPLAGEGREPSVPL
jgi:hypothetical protein